MIVLLIRRAVRERLYYPVVGRALDQGLRWFCSQDGWEDIVSAMAHALIDPSAAVIARSAVAEVFAKYGPYLSRKPTEMLKIVDDAARKHLPEVN